jgi:putative spermidine/putrescine transport system permease protein
MRRMALPLIAGLVLFYSILPILVVVPLSFSSASYLSFPPPGFSLRWYRNFFTRADWLSSAWLSIWVGLAVTVLATTLGTPAAVALVRGRFGGKGLVNAFILSPLIVPGIIVAIGIYFFYFSMRGSASSATRSRSSCSYLPRGTVCRDQRLRDTLRFR